MTRKELEKIGRVLNCGGKGGKPGPCPEGDAARTATNDANEATLKTPVSTAHTFSKEAVRAGSKNHWKALQKHEAAAGVHEFEMGVTRDKKVATAHKLAMELHLKAAKLHGDVPAAFPLRTK